ncbi:sodium:solute symporter family protein [Cardinium endosymbiont of Nabis limbatus]|uniref:sodium:solute symporter family protein n=1 Tax=Cardinium endosymbiont of Nabis limbatus TaxID=3066217 RepID=UPI003AF336DD
MVMAFLLLTLGIGICFTRISTSFREYVLGDQELHTAPLTGTLLALIYGGGRLMVAVEQIHNFGLSWVFFILLTSFLPYWMISWLALRMTPFMRNLSMSESIGRVYGKYPRMIMSLSNICFSIATIAIQINVMSRSISMCIGSVHPSIVTTFVILILFVYARIGGIRIITFTDVAQTFVFFLIIPFLAFSIFEATGKPEICSFLATQENFQLDKLFECESKQLAIFTLFLASLVSSINPPIIQKIYMSADCFQAGMVFFFTSLLSLFVTFFIILLGLYTFVAAPNLSVTEVWGYIMAHISPICKGFVIMSLVAMAMSTADTYLNSCSVMFSNDIVNSVMETKSVPYDRQLRLAKATAFLIGIITTVLIFYCSDLFFLLKLRFDCFIPIATAPFILAVLGFRRGSHTALIGMATGVLTILAWNKWIEPATDMNGAFIAMIANGIAMMVAHYLGPKRKK